MLRPRSSPKSWPRKKIRKPRPNGLVDNMFKSKLSILLVLSCVSTGLAGAANAASRTKDEAKKSSSSAFEFNKKDPIYITADWMEVDQNKNSITYKGRVVAVQADMTMRSETLTAHYDPEMKQMKQIVVEGKVNATQSNSVATG